MKHFLIKFNHGVEIGASLAYLGHFHRTGDHQVAVIYMEEIDHKRTLVKILSMMDDKPFKIIDGFFWLVGNTIKIMCKFSPRFALNFVARTMEAFAWFNYENLAKIYPEYSSTFNRMARTEKSHEIYFKHGREKQLEYLRQNVRGLSHET